MLNFNDVVVRRMIIHTINAKEPLQDTATTIYSTDVLEILPHDVLLMIKQRLIDAAGKNSKAFELKLNNINQGSFFDLINNLGAKTNVQFITATEDIVDLLGSCQTRTNIPGGYLIIMDCIDEDSNCPVYIAIKAEPHEALQYDGHSQLSLLTKVFLSPSQKLYKIGILYKKPDIENADIQDLYGCFLYDDQFRLETHPAEYFYKDFLGFSVDDNSKIQSQRFFDKTQKFIHENIADTDVKVNVLSALKAEFNANLNPTVSPNFFAQTFLPVENGIRDAYIGDVCNELPHAIVKDKALLKTRLSKRKIDFPKNILITGPEESFDENVTIVDDFSLLEEADEHNNFTLVKILGKPYSNE